jgi:hypothetical protein
MTLIIMTHRVMTLTKRTLSMMTLIITIKNSILRISKYLLSFMLNVIRSSVIMLIVVAPT